MASDRVGERPPRDRASRRRFVPWIVVAFAMAIVCVAHTSWCGRDRALPHGDENRYLHAMDRARAAWAAPTGLEKIAALGEVHPTHPPFFPAVASLWAEWRGDDRIALLGIQLVSFVLLAFATFRCGAVLGAPMRGAVAALLLAASPLVFRYTHRFFLELPAAAWTAIALWALLSWRAHGGWGRAFAFALALGLGLLTKWTVVAFVLVPALAVGLSMLKRDDAVVVQLVAGVVLGLAIAAPWYVTHFERLRAFVAWNQENAYWDLASLKTTAGWSFYALKLPHMMGGIPFVLFVAGAVAALFRWRRDGVLAIAVFVPLVVFTVFRTKAYDGRHLLPLFPAAALLGATVITARSDIIRWGGWAAVTVAVPLGLLPAAGIALEHTALRTPVPGTAYSVVGYFEAPAPHDDGAGAVFERIRKDAEGLGRSSLRVFCVAAFGSLNADGLNYLARQNAVSLSAVNPEPRAAGESIEVEPWRGILEADYFVVKVTLPFDSNLNGYRDAFVPWSRYLRGDDPGDELGAGGTPNRRPTPAFVRLQDVGTPDGDRVFIARRERAFDDAVRAGIVTLAARLEWIERCRRGPPTEAEATAAKERAARWLAAAVGVPAVRETWLKTLADVSAAGGVREIDRLRAVADFERALAAPRDRWRDLANAGLAGAAEGTPDDPGRWFTPTWFLHAAVLAGPDDDPLALEAFSAWLALMQRSNRTDEVVWFLKHRAAWAAPAVRGVMEKLASDLGGER